MPDVIISVVRKRGMYCFESQKRCALSNFKTEVFLIFASSRTMPGHIREFDRLKQHSSHDLVFKMMAE